jgi:dimeric dUTPase (all-alpha-NTP-PPase superfamily)
MNINKLATALQNSDKQAILLIQIDLVEYLARKARSTDSEQSEFKVGIQDISPEYSDLFLITICFDQKIDDKIYFREMTVRVHPRFNQAFNCEYNLQPITLEKSIRRYNYIPDAVRINEYLLAGD